MQVIPPALRRRLPVTTLLIMGLIAGAYYFVYVDGKRDYLIDWNFRRLGAMAGGVEERLADYQLVMANTVERAETPEDARKAIQRAAPLEQVGELGYPPAAKPDEPKAAAARPGVRTEVDEGGAWFVITAQQGRELTARLNVAELAASVLETNGFDKLLLARPQGGVFYQQGKREVKLTSLAGLHGADGKPIGLERLAQAAGLLEVELSGKRYRLFTVPCADQWVLAALIRSDRLMLESLKVSSTMLLWLVGLFLLAALALPFLKVLYMARCERLRAIDGLLVSLCAIAGVAALSILLLDAVAYRQLSAAADRQLVQVAQEIHDASLAEVDAAVAQLAALDAEARRRNGEPSVLTGLLRQVPVGGYQDFDTFFWANAQGEQVLKWTVEEVATPFVGVAKRAYFQNALRGRLWRRPGGSFWLEPVSSQTTGEKYAVLSMPAGADAALKELEEWERPRVAALTSRMVSLQRTVLPPATGFAILDRDGAILFHSDARKGLQEKNLLDETDANRSLRALLFARRSGSAPGRYAGRDHLFQVKPMAGLPWSVVTFRDKTLLRTVNIEIVTTALICLLVYVALCVLLFALVYLLPQYRARWVWPAARRRGSYVQLALAYAGCLLLYPALLRVAEPAGLFWAGLLVPAVVLFFSYVKVHRDEGPLGARQRVALAAGCVLAGVLLALLWSQLAGAGRAGLLACLAGGALLLLPRVNAFFRRHTGPSPRLPYVTAAALLLAVVAVLPAVSFFVLAYDLHVESMVKHGQVKLLQALEARREEPRGAGSRVLAAAERETPPGDYHRPFFRTRVSEEACGGAHRGEVHDHWLPALLEDFLPLYNDSSVEMARLGRDRAEDGAWRWDHRRGRLVLHAAGDGGAALHLDSTVPRFTFGPADVGLLLVAVVALGLAMVGIIWFITRKILLLHTHVPAWLGRAALDRPLGGNVIHVSRSRERLRPPKRRHAAVVDLAAAEDAVLAGTAHAPALAGRRLVVVDRFEHRLRDPAFNRAKLVLLEELTRDPERRVALLSRVDPHLFLVGDGDEQQRWARVLGEFESFNLDEAGDPAALAAALADAARRQEERGALSGLERAAWRRHVAACLTAVREECSPTAPLQALGLELVPELALDEMDRGQVLDEIAERADAYYRALWTSLSDVERVALVQIAEEGLVNPKCRRSLLRLQARGLVVRDPELRLLNETFRRFAVSRRREVLPHERRDAEDSPWARLKRPLTAALLGVAVFFFATQREMFNTTLVFVTAVAGSLPQLLKMADFFGGGRRGGAAAGS